MKKLIALILAMCMMAIALSACGGNEQPSTVHPTTKQPSADNSGSIDTDEKLLTVDITLPASFFEGEEDFDADAYAAEQGFTKAVVNADGSVTITMTKAKHKELIDEMTAELDASFAELVGGENTSYIKDITHSEDFSSVEIKVDRAAYESAFDLTPMTIGFSTMMFQAFLEMEHHCEISIVDASNGDIINTVVYPDAFNS